ncbi:MAG: zinc ribbon domain-containing protein [Euryarchaeota archaeon]|nr:zinc ribbon domain-containing protein [Euryarchaeota archaeon]
MIVVLYFEFKYMRPKRRDEIEAVLTKDQAYNALMNAKAVSSALKLTGKDTREAELLLERAQYNYDQRDFVKTIAVAKASKDALLVAKDVPIAEKAVEDQERPEPEEHPVLDGKTVHDAKKLPQNFVESKFLLAATLSDIEKAEKDRNVDEARSLLAAAQASFDAMDYTASVKGCVRAKRSLAGPSQDGSASGVKVVTEVSSMEVVQRSSNTMEERPAAKCVKCGETLLDGDMFCGRCGTEVYRPIKCSRCGSDLGKDDSFCRKCGLKRA